MGPDYRPETCAYCQEDTWCEIRLNGKPQCRACKVERFFSEVLYPPLGYRLIGWQRRVLRGIYGNPEPDTGLRIVRSAYISVGKKNGKSFLIGGLPLYHLLMENEQNPEAYGAAAAKDQATIVFRAAAQLVRANPDIASLLRVLPSTKRILRKDGGGFYAVLSADGDLQDGVEPSLLMRDEIHRWKSARAETLRDVLTKGQISRREPIDIAITTAGAQYESTLWWKEYANAKRVEKESKQGSLFVAIWEADRDRLEKDPEYWKSREARVAANPSHEAYPGGFLRDAAIVAEMDKAIEDPSERSKYFRYHLNVPIAQEEEPIIDMQKWYQCSGGVDLRTWESYNYEQLVDIWDLRNRPCWVGVDASWTTDFTAVVAVFPPFDDVEEWTVLAFFWVPVERVPELERICRQPLASWVEQGFLETTPGNGIDMRCVKERIRWLRDTFDLVEVDFDRVNFRTQAMELQDEDGIAAVEVTQTFMPLSYPTKYLLSSYVDEKLRHGNNPVYNWMASCLQLQYDHKDNCQPSKPERMKSAKRIDGPAATITALSRLLVGQERTIQYTGLQSVGQ